MTYIIPHNHKPHPDCPACQGRNDLLRKLNEGPQHFATGGLVPGPVFGEPDSTLHFIDNSYVIPRRQVDAAKRDAWRRLKGLLPPLAVNPDAPMVCTTHQRFIPCRFDDGCRISQDPSDVERVHRYQRGEQP